MKTLKTAIHRTLNRFGFHVYRLPQQARARIPDGKYYRPLFSPWLGYGDFSHYYDLAKARTIVSPDRCWVLYCLCKQSLSVEGEIWECGVYKGGTAAMLAGIAGRGAPGKRVRLFDTFQGIPETDAIVDIHKKGDFHDATLADVRDYVKHKDITVYHQGLIPQTFDGLEASRIAFAHIDVDIWKSVMDCCTFIFPRLSVGGFMLFDDYGFPSCPGARKAVDEFFSDKTEVPLVLPTGQAVVFKSK